MSVWLGLLAIFLVALVWVEALRGRELALRAGARACSRLDLQFLDETVALVGLRPRRGGDGRVRLRRTYGFEFSVDGVNRYPGRIVVFGRSVESVQLDHPDGRILY
ncbi:MAG: DUF3301 domain-containing protein [Gammaproteobacteria bacterium]